MSGSIRVQSPGRFKNGIFERADVAPVVPPTHILAATAQGDRVGLAFNPYGSPNHGSVSPSTFDGALVTAIYTRPSEMMISMTGLFTPTKWTSMEITGLFDTGQKSITVLSANRDGFHDSFFGNTQWTFDTPADMMIAGESYDIVWN